MAKISLKIWEMVKWHEDTLHKMQHYSKSHKEVIYHRRAIEALEALAIIQTTHYGEQSLATQSPVDITRDLVLWRQNKNNQKPPTIPMLPKPISFI